MRALVGVDDSSLAMRVEASLRSLGFSYFKNQGNNTTGLEVQSPCHFMITIENLSRPQLGFPLRRRVKVESAIQLRRTLGTKDPKSEVDGCVSAFVKDLCAALPGKEWKGLLALGSLTESEDWGAP